ncbi:MAG: MarR family transcriptional regulator [Desulfobacterales bacterium]|nr:MarR family transcriptional regulator [Desulfobacterales bacterium]MCP4162485.1 MarR family transcriptional regulator [Deltaproteobacteria bacterium]
MLNETELIIYTISQIRDKAHKFIIAELKNHNIKGLLPIHGDILYVLFSHKELSMKDIAKLIDRKKSTVTTLIEKLIKLGFIDKRKDVNDKRSFIISLTAKGKSIGGDLKSISKRLIDKVYQDMGVEDRLHLAKLLRKINSNIM